VKLQLTGPGAHDNADPFPGTFSPGADDDFPRLVVLLSTTPDEGALHGPGQNLANLFNITGVNNVTRKSTEVWDTWIVAAPNWAGKKLLCTSLWYQVIKHPT
jgi:hypothetical protein